MIWLNDKVKSNRDSTTKYIFKTDQGQVVEVSYINKNDGKHIICVPCQTMCHMGCKFCHTLEYIGKIPVVNLTQEELVEAVKYVAMDKINDNKMLLVSFMGCGEPMKNYRNILGAMHKLFVLYNGRDYIRFAVATCLPKYNMKEFFQFTEEALCLPIKLHLSLHYTDDTIRSEWMPASLEIKPAIAAVNFFNKKTGNKIEIHYTLIEGVNDSRDDAKRLVDLLINTNFNVKFIFYNKKDWMDYKPSHKSAFWIFKEELSNVCIPCEYYIPPGLDIGASCGQFLLDHYL